jgi:hypothetical protein
VGSDAHDTILPPDDVCASESASPPGYAERARLVADVAVMRELGVVQWGTILLGPAPLPKAERDAQQKPLTPEQERERRRSIGLAASSRVLRGVRE